MAIATTFSLVDTASPHLFRRSRISPLSAAQIGGSLGGCLGRELLQQREIRGDLGTSR
jgi:hypothetical protein